MNITKGYISLSHWGLIEIGYFFEREENITVYGAKGVYYALHRN